MTGVAALAICAAFTSCSKSEELYDAGQITKNEAAQIEENYNRAFIATFGQPAANQDWGFGSSSRAFTRTISAKNGDAYDVFPSAADVAAYFPTAIPENADEVSQLETLYKGTTAKDQWGNDQTLWGLYQIYAYKIVEGYNLKITQAGTVELGGTYQNAGWDNARGKNVIYPYNVYVDVDGDVTIRRAGSTHFNLYILRGNVTLEDNYGEQAGLISVAAGATLNDYRSSIAANQGISLFNRGTVNAKNAEKYDIGNFSKVYNEGKFIVTGALTYSPGDANDSYFMNLGDDAELTAPSMTLNSTGNFFNDGKVTIAGETSVTQARIYWVNAGHYTTGSMTFSAKNATFYNYCQLIVTGNAHMYDGEFNLMNNSYTEAATAEFDNFIVNMGSNSGINIKGATNWIAQGDGTYQGFRVFDGASGSYVRLGGKATVASHKRTLSISSGITYFINEIEIIKNGSVVTEQQLKDNQDGDYPVLDLNGTKAENLTVIPNTTSCGATWSIGGGGSANTETIRVMGEDLTINTNSDFDFNDIVFDVTWGKGNEEATIVLKAAGGQLPIYIVRDDDELEIHALFANANPGSQITHKDMINTTTGLHNEYKCPQITLKKSNNDSVNWDAENIHDFASSIKIIVYKKGSEFILNAPKGDVPSKIAVGTDFEWCNERQDIDKRTDGKFSEYVGGAYEWNTWYK